MTRPDNLAAAVEAARGRPLDQLGVAAAHGRPSYTGNDHLLHR